MYSLLLYAVIVSRFVNHKKINTILYSIVFIAKQELQTHFHHQAKNFMGRQVGSCRQLRRLSLERINYSESENRESKKRKATQRSTSSVSIRAQDNNELGFENVPRQFKSEKSMEKNEDQISEIVINIDDYLQKRDPQLTTDHNISDMNKSRKMCKVPTNIRGLHTHSFDPRLVSIGPFHRNKEHLLPMEEHKWRLLSNVLKKMKMINQKKFEPTANTNSNQIRCLVAAIKELEANARACYSETFDDFGSNEFVMMMLLDGCFVVQLLRLYAKCEQDPVDDPIFSSRWMLPNLQHDLVMFENQLPFIVIEKIFDLSGSDDEGCSLTELTLRFFDSLLPRNRDVLNDFKGNIKPHHLLGLFRSSFLSSFELDNKTTSFALTKKWQLKNCVTELREAGVVFKKSDRCPLLKIEFKNGKLYIPPLHVDDHTGTVFLNFVAYEQCNRYSEPYFTHYLSFLDSLMNSSKDAEYLQKKGIIDHSLGCEEDVADLFNKLCKEVVYDVNDCYLSKTLEEVNQYCCKRRHKWWAKFNHDYVSTPWKLASLIGAIFLLLLTFIQTFFTVFAYILPPS